jgi:DNA-binding CsgD family transcriptional regulator
MHLKDFLTNPEVDVAACLLNGASVKRTAMLLGVSPKTVEAHLCNLMLKLQCDSNDQLIDIVTEAGLLQVLHQHYVETISQGLQSGKENVNVSSKNSGALIFTLFCIISIIALGIILIINIEKRSQVM